MNSSSTDSDDLMSTDAENEVESSNDFQTPKKRKYRRSLHHGFSSRRAHYYDVTPDKNRATVDNSNNFGPVHGFSINTEAESVTRTVDRDTASEEYNDDDNDSDQIYSDIQSSNFSDNFDTSSNASVSTSENESDTTDSDNEEYTSSNESESRYNWNGPLYDGCQQTEITSYTLAMLFVIKHSLSNDAFADLLQLISSHLPQSVRYFKSVYKVKEALKEAINFQKYKLHYYCEECQRTLHNGEPCKERLCRENNGKVLEFYDLQLEQQLKGLFKDEQFQKMIFNQSEKDNVEDAVQLFDMHDGKYYKDKLKAIQQGADLYLTFTINTDGVSLFSSSRKGSLWPVYLAINELPVKLRFSRKFLLPCLLHCQLEKPNMLTYLTPLMKVIQNLGSKGFFVETSKGKLCVKGHLMAAALDLPARAMVANMKQFNGKSSCSACFDEGETVPGNSLHRFFPYKLSRMRTKDSFIRDVREAVRQGEAVNGVKGVVPFMLLDYVDPSTVFPVDWMHCVLLGVCKSLMTFWLNPKYKQKFFFVGDKMSLLNKRLLSIIVPDFVARKPRGLDDHAHWKASECREWLLHFAVPVLHGILPPLPYVHFLLLVTAISYLTKYGVTLAEVDYAEELLEEFLKMYPMIYGRESQTMNVHLLKHLVFYVRQFGPLYTFSCFGFESMNCFIKSLVHGTRHVNNQICFAVGMSKQLAPLITQIISSSNKMIGALAERLGKKFLMENKLELHGDKIATLGQSTRLRENNCHYNLLTAVMRSSSPELYLRVQKGDTVYFSKEYKRAQTFNAYSVCFHKNGNEKGFGFILCFIKVIDEVYAVMEVCETKSFTLEDTVLANLCDVSESLPSFTDRLCPHFVQILPQDQKRLVNVKSLLMKCVLTEASETLKFLSCPPNLLEHD